MKPTTRRTLAAVITGVAAAVGAAATPAAAVDTVPVPVPLDGVEKSLNVELPKLGGEIPLPMPGAPEGPQYVEGRLLPERVLPQLPVSGGLPGLGVHAPLPHILGDDFDHVAVGAPASRPAHAGPRPVRRRPADRAERRQLRPPRAEAARGGRAHPGPADRAGREPGRGTGPLAATCGCVGGREPPGAPAPRAPRAQGLCPPREPVRLRPDHRTVTVRAPSRLPLRIDRTGRSTGWSSVSVE